MMSRVMGNGNIVASWPLTLPVVIKSSLTTSLWATVSAGSDRADWPSGKKSLAANGLTFGWTAIFCAQPANKNIAHTARHMCHFLAWDIEHLTRLQALQKFLRLLRIKFRLIAFAAHTHPIIPPPTELLTANTRMNC